jgi:DNA mismatch repair ATPase MutS
MQVDKITLQDLSIFHKEEESSIFNHINFTQTIGGREWLRAFISTPLDNIKQINETQQTLRLIIKQHSHWPTNAITNGTIMVIERFYDTAIEDIPAHPNVISAFLYRLFHSEDFAVTRYSVKHFIDLMLGMEKVEQLLHSDDASATLKIFAQRINQLLGRPFISEFLESKARKDLPLTELLSFAAYIRRHFKSEVFELIEIYNKLDAYYGMATACIKHQFSFPQLVESEDPFFEVEDLFHPLLQTPVSYSTQLKKENNFLFLTGANMAGKSTFIKAMGVAVYMAHIGMGVPAKNVRMSLFDGLLSNIQVEDNIVKGESYFFNEVQHIKKTIEKITDGKKWLILIDELFKGTNVQDAMKCSTAVIEGLRKMPTALFILSTHLYEIGEHLRQYSNILFKYFETSVEEDQLVFSYQLKDGISNDRLGYLILKKEGVVKMLEGL